MAITAAQRATAVQLLVSNYGNAQVLNQLVPGLTPSGLVTAIVNAVGANFDTQLTTCLSHVVSSLNTQLSAAQAGVTAIQAEISADTVS